MTAALRPVALRFALAVVAGIAAAFLVRWGMHHALLAWANAQPPVDLPTRQHCLFPAGDLGPRLASADYRTSLAYTLAPGALAGVVVAGLPLIRSARVRAGFVALMAHAAVFILLCGQSHHLNGDAYLDAAAYLPLAGLTEAVGVVSIAFVVHFLAWAWIGVAAAHRARAAHDRAETAEDRAEEAEARARRQAEVLREAAEDLPVALAGYDLETNRYTWMNATGRHIYGDPPDLCARPYFEFLAPGEVERAAAVAQDRARAIAEEGVDPGYQGLRLRLRNGRTIEFHQSERPGAAEGVVQFRDVTAEVDAEAERERAQEVAVINARIETRAQVLGDQTDDS